MNIKKIIKEFTPHFLLNSYYRFWAFIGALVFWFPSKSLIVIGVTGTSGKSTTVDFITRILEEPFESAHGRVGNKVASLSSIRFKIADKEWKNELKMTMPGRFTIQKFLRQAVNAKCKYAVLEVTSEGIKQFRHKFIAFDTAVFTNLTPEHIESHGGFENYRNEKLKLFKVTKNIHIINIDDNNAEYFIKISAKEKWIFGIDNYKSQKIDGRRLFETDIKAKNVLNTSNGIDFEIQNVKFHLNVLGEFNIYNALAAISVGLSQRISLEICKKALEKIISIPGRMEIVAKNPFLVVVDYAHTPEQLESVYKTLSNSKSKILNSKQIQNSNVQNSKLICVLGSCGGGRDKWKRPVLGKIAKQYCSKIIVTNEDPYDEDPSEIINQVAESAGNTAKKILDRREAIKSALKAAKSGQIVIITGKGSESLMCLENGKKIPWDDRKIVKEELSKISVQN